MWIGWDAKENTQGHAGVGDLLGLIRSLGTHIDGDALSSFVQTAADPGWEIGRGYVGLVPAF